MHLVRSDGADQIEEIIDFAKNAVTPNRSGLCKACLSKAKVVHNIFTYHELTVVSVLCKMAA